MKAREYAISQGLAQERGKLSRQAHASIQLAILEGYVFDDYKEGRVVKNDNGSDRTNNSNRPRSVVPRIRNNSTDRFDSGQDEEPQKIKSNPATHDYSTVWGIDVLRLGRAIPIAYQFCSKCMLQVKYCVHEVPKLPAYLGGGNALLHYPTQEDLDAALETLL